MPVLGLFIALWAGNFPPVAPPVLSLRAAGSERRERAVLLVRVRVGPSSVDGLGAFTFEPIPSGTVVWRFTPGLDLELDPALLEAQPPLLREVLLHYGWIDRGTGRFLLCCDDARFINHSSTPNLRNEPDTGRYGVDVAARDIAAGEELTLDYALLEGSRPGGF